MQTIALRFTSKYPYNIASWAIAHLTGSRTWSHVMLIANGYAYESLMFYFDGWKLKSGFRKVPVDTAMHGVKKYCDMEIGLPDSKSALEWAQLQEGKPYDFGGAFGLPFLGSDDWQNDSKWWCSEVTFMMIGVGGVWMLDPAEVHRVTPNDLFQCNYKKSEIFYLK